MNYSVVILCLVSKVNMSYAKNDFYRCVFSQMQDRTVNKRLSNHTDVSIWCFKYLNEFSLKVFKGLVYVFFKHSASPLSHT